MIFFFSRKLKVDQDERPGLVQWSRSFARNGEVLDHERNLFSLSTVNPLLFEQDPDIGPLMRLVSDFNSDFRGEMRRIGISGQIVDRVRGLQEEFQSCKCFRRRLCVDSSFCVCSCRYCIDDTAAKGVGYLVDRPCVSIPENVHSDFVDPERQLLLDPFDRRQVCEVASQIRLDTRFHNDVGRLISNSFRSPGWFFNFFGAKREGVLFRPIVFEILN